MPLRLDNLDLESVRRDLEALAKLSDSDFRVLSAVLREADPTLDRDAFHEQLHQRLTSKAVPQVEQASNVLVFLLTEAALRGVSQSELERDLKQIGLGADTERVALRRFEELFGLREHLLRFSTAADAANEALPNFEDAYVALDLRLAYPHMHADAQDPLMEQQRPVAIEPVVIVTIETDTNDSLSFQMNRRQLANLYQLLTTWSRRMDGAKVLADELGLRVEEKTK